MPDDEPEKPPTDNLLRSTKSDETLAALLNDLGELSEYLRQRARHTYVLAQRFVDNAQRNSASRAYDERQATMLEYQHYIWVEIAGLVEKLLTRYADEPQAGEGDAEAAPAPQD